MQEKHGDLIRVRMDFEQKRDDSFNPNETMIWKLEIRYGHSVGSHHITDIVT